MVNQRKQRRDGYLANSYEIVELLKFTHFTKFYYFAWEKGKIQSTTDNWIICDLMNRMGIVADTFRKLPDTYTGQDIISTSGWGKHGKEALTGGLDYPIHNGGKALMLGVDIYKLTAMHYVEGITPKDINNKFEPTEEINRKYPPDEWIEEAGHPPVKAWYKIQDMAYEKGLIRETVIGDCKVMFFDIWSVISLYENELKRDPYGLWGMDAQVKQ